MTVMNPVVTRTPILTHEGGQAEQHTSAQEQLWRTLANCLLFEPQYYEDGDQQAARIKDLIQLDEKGSITALHVANVAARARTELHLRSGPLWAVACLATRRDWASRGVLADTVARVVMRPDELCELVAMYWHLNSRKPQGEVGQTKLPHQLRRGLELALRKFDAYQLAKWNRTDRAVKLADVIKLVHPKPVVDKHSTLWKQLLDGTLPTPDTWEVALSSGRDKKETWERLLGEGKLGLVALLMNLRNMEQVHVDESIVKCELNRLAGRAIALPTQFMSAAIAAPNYEAALDAALFKTLARRERLTGKTLLVVDVSGSMEITMSTKSRRTFMDAAAAVAILVNGVADCRVFTFSNKTMEVPARQGFGLRDSIVQSQSHSGTYLGATLTHLYATFQDSLFDRVIVVTDEQAHDTIDRVPAKRGYIMNVASNERGVAIDRHWSRISGFSERVVDWIRVEEGIGLDKEEEND